MAGLFWFCASLILYVYAGYPLLLTLVARFKPKPQPCPDHFPPVTLLIAAHNEQAVIADKLENTLTLDYPARRLQILVTADGSDDKTPEIVCAFGSRGVELAFDRPRRGKMAAIIRAMPRVSGEIVVYSDANNNYAPDALRALVNPFADPTVGVVAGAKLIYNGDGTLGESEGLYWKYESFIKEQETRLGCCTGFSGEILALRRSLFVPPPEDTINDDFYLAMQAIRRGYRAVYAPNARSYERVSPSARDEIDRRCRINAGWFQSISGARTLLPWDRPLIVWQVVSHKFLRPFVPLAMAGMALATIAVIIFPATVDDGLLHLAPPFNVLALLCQLAFFGLAWLGNRMERTANRRLPFYLYLPTFLFNSNWAALVGLYRFLTRRQTVLWQRLARR